MTALQFGDVVLIEVEFHQARGSKIRPATVVLDSEDDDFVAAPITSRPSVAEFDLTLHDWRAAGLNVASTSGCTKSPFCRKRTYAELSAD